MNTTSRNTSLSSKKESKDETSKTKDEKLRKSTNSVSTSRNFVQKSSTADIYAQKKKAPTQNPKAPKKVVGTTNITNETPMKSFLKSSASSVSQISRSDTPRKNDSKSSVYSARRNETPKKPAVTNVTVNSPATRRRLDLNSERFPKEGSMKNSERSKEFGKLSRQASNVSRTSEVRSKEVGKLTRQISNVSITKEVRKEPIKEVFGERQRTKTRTLDENEVKILTHDAIDNNAGMMNLSQKLVAKSKAFYVDLDEGQSKPKKDKSSDEDVSYEDDFESYESDFDSYHSDQTDRGEASEKSETSEKSRRSERNEETASAEESSLKEKDDEKMLDSGNFDLRDQRSGKLKPVAMDFILEDSEDRKTVSLTDEGFQDMSSSSAGSSLKTQQADRPLFIDLTKSKQSKQRRKINQRLQQRAKDLLSMITLHEMSFSLFEMQPISYDLYMATFGRSNYTQIGVQTFDDGITEEIQTEDVTVNQKWTQHPVEFSKSDIYRSKDNLARKYSKHTEDYFTKFTFMMNTNIDEQGDIKINSDESYKSNPLRVFLEQKDGAGGDDMLPYETYKSKLKSNDYNSNRLGKFLKKFESNISHVLSSNAGDKDVTNLAKSDKIPFSKGFFSLSTKTTEDEKLSFLKFSKITLVIFSETKADLILTVHKNVQNMNERKSLICLWDLSVARTEPIKFLTAIDDVVIGRFKGNVKGVFVAALDDGSIHLWDLTEEPTLRNDDDKNEKKAGEIVEIDNSKMTSTESDREWNLKNSHVAFDKPSLAIALQSCAFTSSGANLTTKDEVDCIVGLEMNTDAGNMDAGKRIVGQILSLQRVGILTIWSIIQDKLKSAQDIGKAFMSKMKLEKCQTIKLADHIDITSKHNFTDNISTFNLNSAKRRLSLRKKEKALVKAQNSRPQSAVASKFNFDIDRPSSAASMRKQTLPVEINYPKSWEAGLVCNDLKILRIDDVDNYLVAKNCGEVLCCKRCLGAVKVLRFSVSTDTSSVTNLEVSTKGLPYFLAATDTGTVNLCSVLDNRVLLTLDCRNTPSSHDADVCQADSKGRFISSISTRRPDSIDKPLGKLEIKSVHWSPVNPCSIHVLLQDNTIVLFELTHSDIYAKYVCDNAAKMCAANDFHLDNTIVLFELTHSDIYAKYVCNNAAKMCAANDFHLDNTIVLFELTHSDIYAKYVCDNAAKMCAANDFHLAMLTPAGEVQVHRLAANESQTKDNLKIFHKYVALL